LAKCVGSPTLPEDTSRGSPMTLRDVTTWQTAWRNWLHDQQAGDDWMTEGDLTR
jgi:hypothetical protein